MIRKAEAERVLVRLPKELKVWIQGEAARNGASQNSEIIRSIRARMDGQQQPERAAG
jgi:hypothetical protein